LSSTDHHQPIGIDANEEHVSMNYAEFEWIEIPAGEFIHANSQLVGRVSLTNDEPIPLLTLDNINTNALDADVHDLLKEALSYINAGLIVANEGDETARASLSDTHAINVYGADVAEVMMENAGLVHGLAFGGIGSGMLFSPDSSWGVGV
jgi:hypothetical protein